MSGDGRWQFTWMRACDESRPTSIHLSRMCHVIKSLPTLSTFFQSFDPRNDRFNPFHTPEPHNLPCFQLSVSNLQVYPIKMPPSAPTCASASLWISSRLYQLSHPTTYEINTLMIRVICALRPARWVQTDCKARSKAKSSTLPEYWK